MVHAAVYDAVNAISPTYQPYQVKQKAAAKTSKEAAAVTAAYYVLNQLYPNQVTNLNTELDAYEQEIPAGESKTQGIEFGKSVAEQIVKWRQDDGSTSQVTYIPINKPGYWQPVPPDFKAASMTHWQNVKYAAMRSNSQFRIDKMPSLTSAEYAFIVQLYKDSGRKTEYETNRRPKSDRAFLAG